MNLTSIKVMSKITDDPRELPAYSIVEAAHYLRIPLATLRSWIRGRYYDTTKEKRFFEPLIRLPEKAIPILSFNNLVEVHILDAIRRNHKIQMYKIRDALKYIEKNFKSKHPLIEQKFETDGLNLFVSEFGKMINITQAGQLAMRELLSAHLQRIEHDEKGLAVKLYPFTRKRNSDEPKIIVIDPYVSFGRPIVAKSGIATNIIAERYKAGESMDQLADDYNCERFQIEEAIRCELDLAA